MKKCYRCDENLSDTNSTIEHIIINACGGRLKSKELLCKSCNSLYGNTFDKDLANQTNSMVNLLRIKREKGEAQPIKATVKSTGEDYYFYSNDKIEKVKPTISLKLDGDNSQLKVQAPNMKIFKQVLEGHKKKYPNLDIEKAYDSAVDSFEKINEAINIDLSIGGEETFRAITKTAINFFIYKGGSRKEIEHLLPYLDSVKNDDVVWMHYPDEEIYLPNEREVSHVIKLVGSKEEKILYAYVQLFSCQNYLVKLSDNYSGIPFNETYIFDLNERVTVNREINLAYPREHLLEVFRNKDYKPFENAQKAFQRVMNLSIVFRRERKLEEIATKVWNNTLGKYPPGTVVTEEMAAEVSSLLANEIVPLLNLRHD